MSARVPAPWARCFAERPDAEITLLCFPHAGGSASFYRPWGPHLPPNVEQWAVQYPGREDRFAHPMIDDMAALADAVVAALEPALDRPVVLFGHSMGGSVAHEVAIRLARSRPGLVRRLVASARPGPDAQALPADPVYLRGDDAVRARVARYGGAGQEVLDDPQLGALLLPMIRNDFQLVETYKAGPEVLDIEVVALAADTDPSMPAEAALAWEAATTGRFAFHLYPGGHFYLADHLPSVIERALGPIEPEEPTMPADEAAIDETAREFTVDGLRAAVAEALGVDPAAVTPGANLFELGLDSMRMMALSVRWQAHGVEVPFADLAEKPTVADWSRVLGHALGERG